MLAPTNPGDSGDTTRQRVDLSALDQGLGPAPWPDGKAYWHAAGHQRPAQVAGVERFATMGLWADCVARYWSRATHADKVSLERACGRRPTPERRRS